MILLRNFRNQDVIGREREGKGGKIENGTLLTRTKQKTAQIRKDFEAREKRRNGIPSLNGSDWKLEEKLGRALLSRGTRSKLSYGSSTEGKDKWEKQ